MRLLFRGGRKASKRPLQYTSSLATLMALAPILSQSLNFEAVPSSNLDFSGLGSIGIAGDFNGISMYQYEGQGGGQSGSGGAQSLLGLLPNGAVADIVSTDASISDMCVFALSNGEVQGVVMGGNFTSLDGTKSTAMALLNPNTSQITPLAGLAGQVNAIWCDNDRSTVYVGGNFKGGNSTNAIAWVGSEGWTNLPFAGFNGPVESVTKASNGHIIFGGSFTGLGNASAPSKPDGQTINLSTANITTRGSVTTSGFNDPSNIVCSNGTSAPGSAWLAPDKTPGLWQAEFDFGFEPTKLRLWNSQVDGRGTKTFRFISLPSGGIMNLTFIDLSNGQNTSCTSECPLSDDSSIEFQDFHFVNVIGMNGFQIAISDWYGDGAGLAGIGLFEDNIFSYAVNSFNEPTCGNISFPSTATATGPWNESPSLESSSKYLTADLTGSITPQSASVVFTPDIQESGFYSVNMYTPGCIPDNSCTTRGQVNVSGVMSTSNGSNVFTTTLYQTNNFEKYDQIYFGYIEQSSDSFKPTVTLTPLAGQGLNTQTIVAERVGFSLINSTGGLSGLFEYNPDLAVVNTSGFQESTIDMLGSSFNDNSAVMALATDGEVMYVAGNFTSSDHRNIVAVKNNDEVVTLDGGLNGQVSSMYLSGNELFVGGGFTNTLTGNVNGLGYAAVYDTSKEQWTALGAGVDGPVDSIVPMQINVTANKPETVITFSGAFTQCKAFEGFAAVSVNGFAIWVPSESNWLQNLNGTFPSYSGVLTSALLNLPNNGGSIFAGSLSSAQISVNGAATLGDGGLGTFPVSIQPQSSSSTVQRRDTLSTNDISGVVTGLFYDENDSNITVLAGHFSAHTTNGSSIDNLVLIDGNANNTVSGLGSSISPSSTYLAVANYQSILFAGGKLTGTVKGNKVSGIVAYNMTSGSFANQPAAVSGGDATVAAISPRPSSTEVYVGGSFENAGALDCPGICMYNVANSQWIRPGSQLAGNVQSLLWTSDSELVAGGNLTANDTQPSFLAVYNANNGAWTEYPGSSSLPGPVGLITPASSDASQLWVAGTATKNGSIFLMKYDGNQWLQATPSLPAGTDLRGLQVFTLSQNHDKTSILDQDEVLMLTGAIAIPGFGTASAAIYNGTTFQPYLLTTTSDNSLGTIAKIFSQNNGFFSANEHYMPLVFVVLIGLAVALGLILLLVLCGIVLDRWRKKRDGYTPAPTSMYDRGNGIRRIPPRELLESLGKGPAGAPHV